VDVIDLENIHSLTDFRHNTKKYVEQLQENKSPLVLTINGEAVLVVQEIRSFQSILKRLHLAESELRRLEVEALKTDALGKDIDKGVFHA
jgi:PHD/YefM family antitoxin component YafN of YafNO toxin-antitoxin module